MGIKNSLQFKRFNLKGKILLRIFISIQNKRKSQDYTFMSIFIESIDFAKGLEKTFIVTSSCKQIWLMYCRKLRHWSNILKSLFKRDIRKYHWNKEYLWKVIKMKKKNVLSVFFFCCCYVWMAWNKFYIYIYTFNFYWSQELFLSQ